MDPSTSTHASSSSHTPSSPRQADPSHHAYSSPDAPSEHDSSRSRLFSSGRKSPDPFRRFRRNSNNSLHILTAPPTLDAAQSFDAQQYHLERQDRSVPDYPAALNTPRSAPPPLPSPSTKPDFQRPKRTKSSSISILSSGLARRPKDSLPPSSSSPDVRRRHRKSASLSGSDVDFSSSNSILDSNHSRPTTPMMRPASPSPSLSDSLAFPAFFGCLPLQTAQAGLVSGATKDHRARRNIQPRRALPGIQLCASLPAQRHHHPVQQRSRHRSRAQITHTLAH
ncbi:hypothetical protein L1887_55257 [Cichorium endivia]|nr:hypothetical protein L1887_55257 [Cichorium endivia]